MSLLAETDDDDDDEEEEEEAADKGDAGAVIPASCRELAASESVASAAACVERSMARTSS